MNKKAHKKHALSHRDAALGLLLFTFFYSVIRFGEWLIALIVFRSYKRGYQRERQTHHRR